MVPRLDGEGVAIQEHLWWRDRGGAAKAKAPA